MDIDPNDFYMIFADGEPVIPDDFDFVLDCWTAEAVQVFIEAVNPDKVVSIEPANLRPLTVIEVIQ